VHDSALNDALQADAGCRLGGGFGQDADVCVDEVRQLAFQDINIDLTGLERMTDIRAIEKPEQKVLDGHKFISAYVRIAEDIIQRAFQLFAQESHGFNSFSS